ERRSAGHGEVPASESAPPGRPRCSVPSQRVAGRPCLLPKKQRGGLMPIACRGGEAYTAIVAACPANCFFEFIKNVSGSARMKRLSCYMLRMLPVISLALAAIAHGENSSVGRQQERFELVETTIADIQQAYRSEVLTPEQLVKMYQARIAAFDRAGPHLNGYMYVNPNAADAARELMRKSDNDGDGHEAFPLYGVPGILKEQRAQVGMPTAAASARSGHDTT